MASSEMQIPEMWEIVAGRDNPINLAHLSAMTLGDEALQKELLELFMAQVPEYLGKAQNCQNKEEVARVAHTIKGAARGVGAFALSNLAERFEETGEFNYSELETEFQKIIEFVSAS